LLNASLLDDLSLRQVLRNALLTPRPPSPGRALERAQVTGLVAAIGQADATSFAAEVLNTLGAAQKISQCTIFAYEFGNRPRAVSVADSRGGRFLSPCRRRLFETLLRSRRKPRHSDRDARRKAGRVDGEPSADQRRYCPPRLPHGVYSAPNVRARLSLLLQPADHIWLLVKFVPRQHASMETKV
jgi:hypothetical protein